MPFQVIGVSLVSGTVWKHFKESRRREFFISTEALYSSYLCGPQIKKIPWFYLTGGKRFDFSVELSLCMALFGFYILKSVKIYFLMKDLLGIQNQLYIQCCLGHIHTQQFSYISVVTQPCPSHLKYFAKFIILFNEYYINSSVASLF